MTPSISFLLNSTVVDQADPDTTLLDYLRQNSHTATKEGCGEGSCGACAVLVGELEHEHIRYMAVPACLLRLGSLKNKHVVTGEGLLHDKVSPIEQAFAAAGALQCGFCTQGFLVALTGYLVTAPTVTVAGALQAISGNICRCTGYEAIREAVKNLNREYQRRDIRNQDRLAALIEWGIVPAYFLSVKDRLCELQNNQARPAERLDSRYQLRAGGTDLDTGSEEERSHQVEARSWGVPVGIKDNDDHIWIGAATTVETMRTNPLIGAIVPDVVRGLLQFGSILVRNLATVGGNIVKASPTADISVLLLALDAWLEVKHFHNQAERNVPLEKFFTGYHQIDLADDEYVAAVCFPKPPVHAHFSYEKVSVRPTGDVASVNTASLITTKGSRIMAAALSMGGVGPTPQRLSQTERVLSGALANQRTVAAAMRAVAREIQPITDLRGSAEYKCRLAQRLLAAHLSKLFPDKLETWDDLFMADN